jgi:hypothetical protein
MLCAIKPGGVLRLPVKPYLFLFKIPGVFGGFLVGTGLKVQEENAEHTRMANGHESDWHLAKARMVQVREDGDWNVV